MVEGSSVANAYSVANVMFYNTKSLFTEPVSAIHAYGAPNQSIFPAFFHGLFDFLYAQLTFYMLNSTFYMANQSLFMWSTRLFILPTRYFIWPTDHFLYGQLITFYMGNTTFFMVNFRIFSLTTMFQDTCTSGVVSGLYKLSIK